MIDKIPCPNSECEYRERELQWLIGCLPVVERDVMNKLCVCEFTQSQTAHLLGISQQQVSRVRARAIARLKKS